MAKSTFTNPYIEAALRPITVGGEEVPSKVAVIVPDDDGKRHVVGIQAAGYNLIQNSLANDVAIDIFSRSEYDWKTLKQHWDGRKYVQYFITEQKITQITNGGDHAIHLGAMIRNSYDGTSAYGMEMFACNMECTNQYISRNRFGYFAIRHIGDHKFDIDDGIKNISQGAQNLIAVAPKIQALRDSQLTLDDVMEAKEKTQIPHSRWGDVIDQLKKEEGTRFGLFQALTFVASHILTGYNAISVGDSISEYMI